MQDKTLFDFMLDGDVSPWTIANALPMMGGPTASLMNFYHAFLENVAGDEYVVRLELTETHNDSTKSLPIVFGSEEKLTATYSRLIAQMLGERYSVELKISEKPTDSTTESDN